MKRKKTTRLVELTIERSEYFVATTRRETTFAWCERCGGQVRFIGLAEATCASGASMRAIIRRIESEQVHSLETSDGHLLVCVASLG